MNLFGVYRAAVGVSCQSYRLVVRPIIEDSTGQCSPARSPEAPVPRRRH